MSPTATAALREDLLDVGPGRYELELHPPVDEGSTGTLLRARQKTAANRLVVFKVFTSLPKDAEEQRRFLARMKVEVEALAAVRHRNIVGIIDSGTFADGPFSGLPYIVMEYVPGRSLQSAIEGLRPSGELFSADAVAKVLREVGEAIQALAEKGITHRDIKPGNILFDSDGTARLADLGLARIEGVSPGLTREGIPIGTPLYMSPEQSEGRRCDVRSDLYSLGAVAYEMSTGQPPHGRLEAAGLPGGKYMDVLFANVNSPPPRICGLNPEFPAALAAVIHRLIEKDPELRYPSADEFLEALQSAVEPRRGRRSVLDELLGVQVGSYKVESLVGKGASGAVFKAHDENLARPVALKFLLAAHDVESQRRFEREAQNAAKLNHPNVVGVYAAGCHEDMPWIAMHYVEGRTLRRLTETQGKLPLRLALTIARQALLGSSAAHDRGLIHRDIKPENILVIGCDADVLDPDRVQIKVADFGLLRSVEQHEPRITETGVFYGTPEFTSPEQARGEELDHRTDQYSLGVCLYEMLAGQLPYSLVDPSPLAWLAASSDPARRPTPLSSQRPDVPREIEILVHRMMAKRREDRYPDCRSAAEEIARLVPKLHRERPKTGRRIAVVGGILVAAVATCAVVWNPFRSRHSPLIPTPEGRVEVGEKVETPVQMRESEVSKTIAPEESVKSPPNKRAISIRDQLASSSPTADDLAFLRSLLDLAASERTAFLARSYGQFLSRLDAGIPGGSFRALHLGAARDLAELAESVVRMRCKTLSTKGSHITVTQMGGSTFTGTVKEATADSVTIQTENGEVRVQFAKLASTDFLSGDIFWDARIAFKALSISPIQALEELLTRLPSDDRVAPWIPFVVRLARHEALELVRTGAFSEAQDHFNRLISSQDAGDEAFRISHIFPHLEDFDAVRTEQSALSLLVVKKHAEVATAYSDTAAYPHAAKALLEDWGLRVLGHKDLCERIAAIDRGLEAKLGEEQKKRTPAVIDLVGGYEGMLWGIEPQQVRERENWDREPRGEVNGKILPAYIILRDPTGFRKLTRNNPVPTAERGLVLCYRFRPTGESSHWRLWIPTIEGANLYLRLTPSSVELYKPFFGEGASDELLYRGRAFEAPADPDAWRTLTLLPVGSSTEGVILIYVDGDPLPVLHIPLRAAHLPQAPSIAVSKGEIHLKNLIAIGELP